MSQQELEEGLGQVMTKTEIDYLIVADRADVQNGKLYLMGGSFDRITPPEFPFDLMLGLAVGVRVPYHETDEPHKIEVSLAALDAEPLFKIEGEITTGRAPGMRGMDMLVPMAFNMPIKIPGPGQYILKATVDGRVGRRHELKASIRGK